MAKRFERMVHSWSSASHLLWLLNNWPPLSPLHWAALLKIESPCCHMKPIWGYVSYALGLPWWPDSRVFLQWGRSRFDPWVRKIPWEKEMATPLQYSCLENSMDGGAWRLQSVGLQRVGHDWATSLSFFLFNYASMKMSVSYFVFVEVYLISNISGVQGSLALPPPPVRATGGWEWRRVSAAAPGDDV